MLEEKSFYCSDNHFILVTKKYYQNNTALEQELWSLRDRERYVWWFTDTIRGRAIKTKSGALNANCVGQSLAKTAKKKKNITDFFIVSMSAFHYIRDVDNEYTEIVLNRESMSLSREYLTLTRNIAKVAAIFTLLTLVISLLVLFVTYFSLSDGARQELLSLFGF